MEDSTYQWTILFRKYRYKTITQEELKELQSLINTDPIKMQQFKQWIDRREFNKQLRYYRSINIEASWNKLVATCPSLVTPAPALQKKKSIIYKYKIGTIAAAAVGLTALIYSAYYFSGEKKEELSPVVKKYNYVQQVAGAEYELGNGTSNAIFASQRPELNDQDTLLAVTAPPDGSSRNNDLYDVVTAPKKQMKVQFADGSRVTLFPSTALRFPLAFTTREREVQMSGQAFFQVASNEKVPFIVHLNNGIKVEAKGTEFNIASFENGKIILTLLSGNVTMYYKNKKIDVHPGEQIEFTADNKFKRLYPRHYEQAIAWTHNTFIYENKEVKDVLMEIAQYHHYNLLYKDELPPTYSTGKLDMNKLLEDNLDAVSAVNNITIKLQGNTIVVSRAANNQIH